MELHSEVLPLPLHPRTATRSTLDIVASKYMCVQHLVHYTTIEAKRLMIRELL